MDALEAGQATLERERPKAALKHSVATPEVWEGLDLDRRRAVVESLVKAVVVDRPARRGAPWTPDRLEVVWWG